MDFIHSWVVPPASVVDPRAYIAIALVAFLLTSVSKGGFGGGIGILSVPLMLQAAPSTPFVLGLWLPMLVACDACTIRQYPKQWNHKAFWHLSPGMLIGITAATVMLKVINPAEHPDRKDLLNAWLQISTGIICLVFLVLQLRPAKAQDEPWQPTWLVAIPVGIAAGITTTVAHAAGPILLLFLLPQKMDQRTFVGTTGRFFFIFNVIKVPYFVFGGLVTGETLRYGLWLIVLAPLGVWFGAWLNKKVSAVWFVRIVQISLVGMAGKLVNDGIQALQHANVH